jgi:hypothetical protein
MIMIRSRWLVRAGIFVVAIVCGIGLSAGAATLALVGAHVEETGCEGITGIALVDANRVRPLVPDHENFTVFTREGQDEEGQPTTLAQVEVGAVRCDEVRIYEQDGTLRSVVQNHLHFTFRVLLCDPGDPPDVRCAALGTGIPDVDPGFTELFHGYTLWLTTNNRDLARFFREQGGNTDRQAVYADDLVFRIDDPDPTDDLATLTVKAPSAPSPFVLTAAVRPANTLLGNIFGDFWAGVPAGTMVQQPDRLTLFRIGEVTEASVTPKKSSEMDRVFCTTDGRSSGGRMALSTGDSLHIAFASGEFAVRTDTTLDTPGTGHATCDWTP